MLLQGKENCYYHGRVEEHPDWSVVISTCFGIRYSARSGGVLHDGLVHDIVLILPAA